MDPDAVLLSIRAHTKGLRDRDPREPYSQDEAENADVLADQIEALDAWITSGGFMPSAWQTRAPRMAPSPTANQFDYSVPFAIQAVRFEMWGQTINGSSGQWTPMRLIDSTGTASTDRPDSLLESRTRVQANIAAAAARADHRDVHMRIVFTSQPIPANEVLVDDRPDLPRWVIA